MCIFHIYVYFLLGNFMANDIDVTLRRLIKTIASVVLIIIAATLISSALYWHSGALLIAILLIIFLL